MGHLLTTPKAAQEGHILASPVSVLRHVLLQGALPRDRDSQDTKSSPGSHKSPLGHRGPHFRTKTWPRMWTFQQDWSGRRAASITRPCGWVSPIPRGQPEPLANPREHKGLAVVTPPGTALDSRSSSRAHQGVAEAIV